MFRRILVPSDGSILGTIAALKGIELASKLGSEVIGIYVAEEYRKPAFGPSINPTPEEYATAATAAGDEVLRPLKDAAAKAGVKFTGLQLTANRTALAIVSAAERNGCGLIFIGSHGCAGWDHVLMGSVSNKVLATARMPVLIYRLKRDEVPDGVPQSYEAVFPPA